MKKILFYSLLISLPLWCMEYESSPFSKKFKVTTFIQSDGKKKNYINQVVIFPQGDDKKFLVVNEFPDKRCFDNSSYPYYFEMRLIDFTINNEEAKGWVSKKFVDGGFSPNQENIFFAVLHSSLFGLDRSQISIRGNPPIKSLDRISHDWIEVKKLQQLGINGDDICTVAMSDQFNVTQGYKTVIFAFADPHTVITYQPGNRCDLEKPELLYQKPELLAAIQSLRFKPSDKRPDLEIIFEDDSTITKEIPEPEDSQENIQKKYTGQGRLSSLFEKMGV